MQKSKKSNKTIQISHFRRGVVMAKTLTRMVLMLALSILLTADSRAQWTQTNGPYGGYIYSLGVSGGYVLAGTHGAGAYRSSDNGTTWTTASSGLVTPHVYAFLTKGSNLFAGCPGTGGGIWVSTDNGGTWTWSGSGLTSTEVYGLTSLDTNLFAATLYGGVFISTNNGTYWTPVNAGLGTLSVWTIATDGTNLLAGTYGAGAYISTDNGTNWTESDSGITNKYVEQFAVNGAGIFAGTFGSGVFLSTDHGAHWNPVITGLTDLYIRALLADGSNIYCANDNGVALSTDNGAHWQSMNNGLQNLQVYSLMKNGSWLFAGTNGGGSVRFNRRRCNLDDAERRHKQHHHLFVHDARFQPVRRDGRGRRLCVDRQRIRLGADRQRPDAKKCPCACDKRFGAFRRHVLRRFPIDR